MWGHEHECLIDPRYNPEMDFHVMQPGSSVATSLMPGEAVPKHVAMLSITGKEFKVETIRLKSVRPFVMKEIVLSEEREPRSFVKKDNRIMLTRYLVEIVEDLIKQAQTEWLELQVEEEHEDEPEVPLPLIRLRVEYSAPNGGNFDCENPQRFSNRFVGKVANVNDVVQFYRKKAGAAARKAQNGAELPEESILAQLSIDSIKVEKLVREFLTAQSLTILPQNSFGDAVSQFVEKDDKHAMEMFVNESLTDQIRHLMDLDYTDEDEHIQSAMDEYKSKLEELFAAGRLKKRKTAKLKPRPSNWDSELDGEWGAQPGALVRSDIDEGGDVDDDDQPPLPAKRSTRGGRKEPASKPRTTAAKKPAPAKGRGSRKKVVEEEEEDGEEDEDIIMVDADNDESQLFVQPSPPPRPTRKAAAPKKTAPPATRTSARGASKAPRQTKLTFSQPSTQANGRGTKPKEVSDDDISDDDEAFEPVAPAARSTRSRR